MAVATTKSKTNLSVSRKFFRDRGYYTLQTGLGCRALCKAHVDVKIDQTILITGDDNCDFPEKNGPWSIGFYPDDTGNPSESILAKTPKQLIKALDRLEKKLEQHPKNGGVAHVSHEIKKAIRAGHVFYSSATKKAYKNLTRIYSARIINSQLEVRIFGNREWVSVRPNDYLKKGKSYEV